METIEIHCPTSEEHKNFDLTLRVCKSEVGGGVCSSSLQKCCTICSKWTSFANFARHQKSCVNMLMREEIKRLLMRNEKMFDCIGKASVQVLSHSMDYWPSIIPISYDSKLEASFKGKFVGDKSGQCSPGSLLLIHRNTILVDSTTNAIVGGIAYNVFSNRWADHLLSQMKASVSTRPAQKRSASRSSTGKMVGVGIRSSYNHGFVDEYSVGSKLGEEAKMWEMQNGEQLSGSLYSTAQKIVPFATTDYETFRKCTATERGVPAALFATKNYVACGHTDNDYTEFAVGFTAEDGQLNGGLFFYPPYGVAIKLEHNCVWWWKTDKIHGTAVINRDASTGDRYTAVLTLSKRTAQAVKRTLASDTEQAKRMQEKVLKIK